MGKKQRHSGGNAASSSQHNDSSDSMLLPDEFLLSPASSISHPPLSLLDWIQQERQSLSWILGCAALGALLGFGVGAGWLTRGYGSWHFVLKDPTSVDTSDPRAKQEFVRKFMITPWRVLMAHRTRNSLLYEIITHKKSPWVMFEYFIGSGGSMDTGAGNWFATSPMWPPNWILFRQVDLSNIEVGEGGLSPTTMKFLSIVLPWRRNLIKALARKDKKVTLRDADGNLVEDTGIVNEKSPNSFASRIKQLLFGPSSSSQNKAPVDAYYHPMGFYALREYIIRHDHGFVHPDLGFLIPAPSGASRGIGMVSDSYTKCQRSCFPGTTKERKDEEMVARKMIQELQEQQIAEQEIMDEMKQQFPELSSEDDDNSQTSLQSSPSPPPLSSNHKTEETTLSTTKSYSQHELLMHIPLSAQITRSTALEILNNILPEEIIQNQLGVLDDAFVLAILLAHERGLGDSSRFWPYIATLPPRPTCAIYPASRQSVVDVVTALSVEMGTDVVGWPSEISKAAEVAERIVNSLSNQYKVFLATPPGMHLIDTLRWALCHVASRAIAGRESHGRLRLVPMMDLINHDAAAGKFHEIVGNETNSDTDFALHAEESDSGAFVVRSRRHGRNKPLKKGQELMADYNVPKYSPLDWFINMGFVPPERTGKWTMLEAGLPPNYRGGFSRKNNGGTISGAFGAGKPEIQVIRQHTSQSTTPPPPPLQQQQPPPFQPQQQETCQS